MSSSSPSSVCEPECLIAIGQRLSGVCVFLKSQASRPAKSGKSDDAMMPPLIRRHNRGSWPSWAGVSCQVHSSDSSIDVTAASAPATPRVSLRPRCCRWLFSSSHTMNLCTCGRSTNSNSNKQARSATRRTAAAADTETEAEGSAYKVAAATSSGLLLLGQELR